MQEFPKWVKVGGKGHPQNPGHVLVETEDQEREALATGQGPRELNPPLDEDVVREPIEVGRADGTVEIANETAEDKPLADQGRKELIDTLVRETLTDEVTDDHLRDAISHAREHGSRFTPPERGAPEAFEPSGKPVDEMDREELINTVLDRAINSDASDADLRFVIMVLAGDVRDNDDAHEELGNEAGGEKKDAEPLVDAAGDKAAPDPAAEANKGDATKPAPGAPAAKSAPATDATPKEGADKVADDKPAGNVTDAAATPPEHKKGTAKPAGKK